MSSSYPSNHFLLLLSPYHGPGTLPRAKDLCFSVLLLMTVHACAQSLSGVGLFATPWTVAHQAPLSMGFSRQEYWSGLPCPSPGNLPDPGIEPRSPELQADSLLSEPPGKTIQSADIAKCSSGGTQWPLADSHWNLKSPHAGFKVTPCRLPGGGGLALCLRE